MKVHHCWGGTGPIRLLLCLKISQTRPGVLWNSRKCSTIVARGHLGSALVHDGASLWAWISHLSSSPISHVERQVKAHHWLASPQSSLASWRCPRSHCRLHSIKMQSPRTAHSPALWILRRYHQSSTWRARTTSRSYGKNLRCGRAPWMWQVAADAQPCMKCNIGSAQRLWAYVSKIRLRSCGAMCQREIDIKLSPPRPTWDSCCSSVGLQCLRQHDAKVECKVTKREAWRKDVSLGSQLGGGSTLQNLADPAATSEWLRQRASEPQRTRSDSLCECAGEPASKQQPIINLQPTYGAYKLYIYAGELFLVPLFWNFKSQEQYHKKTKSFLQQPEANQELETDPPDS